MCGICGVLELGGAPGPSEALVRRMSDSIRHRGPDDAGELLDGPVGLGHRRLSIIDLEGGHQPLSNEDATVWIVFNGEIYNHQELATRLKGLGHRFRTRSDTEAIVHAYEEWGESCVDHLRGMFAFAIWDSRRRRLFLARDRVGIKPLYWARFGDRLYFASEIKAILADDRVPRAIDAEQLETYLSLRYTPGPGTMMKGVHKLPAGCTLTAEAGSVRLRPYWDLEFGDHRGGSLDAWAEEFRAKLEEAVRIRLMSEVPLGAFLSGGIDSSVTVALMSGMTDLEGPVRTFSVGYEDDPDISELPYARLVAERYGTDHRELEITADDYWGHVPRMVWHLDEPVADFACLPLMLMSDLTREHVTVILSGEGADELLGGYGLYRKMALLERARGVPGARSLLPVVSGAVPDGKLRRYLRQVGLPLEARYRGISTAFDRAGLSAVYPDARPERVQALVADRFARVEGQPDLHRMLYFDTRVYLPDDLLVKADKMTMAASLELRVPFLDHELMELAARLPPEAKNARGETKRILRRIAEPLVPRPVLTRAKKGFPVPIERWLSGDLTGVVEDRLLSATGALAGLVDPREVTRLVERHNRGAEDCSDRIWTLIVLEQWKRMFVDASSEEARAAPPSASVGV